MKLVIVYPQLVLAIDTGAGTSETGETERLRQNYFDVVHT